MGAEGLAGQPALEVPGTDGLKRVRVDLIRLGVLLQRQQPSAVPDDVGVGGAAVQTRHARIVGETIAVDAEKPPARGPFRHQPFGADITAAVVDPAAGEAEQADVAVAIEARAPLVFRRRIGEVALQPVEAPLEIGRQFAIDLAIEDIRLEPRRGVEAAAEQWVTGETHRHG